MNKTAIKNFAIWSRNKLIADVKYRAGLMGITEHGIASALSQSTGTTEFYDIGTAEPYVISGDEIKQRKKLVEALRQKEADTDYATAYKYIIEEVAYTWFNRLIAVRFMEVNDYLPSHARVLSSESGKLEPDLVTNPFDADLNLSEKEKTQILQLKQENKVDELFRMLFIKQCNELNDILPALFEKTSDYTEVLLNVSYIDQDGVVNHLVNDIDEDDFNIEKGGQVEIIGWLYQYYNTEPKNEAFAKDGKITKEEIPAVTQLFTPDWIVRYMVVNSLGRLWLEGHPNDSLKRQWKYYLDEAEQEPEVEAKLVEIREEHAKLNPEDIKLIDPCMGSGHILVYAFDVFMQIYDAAGWNQRDAAKSILENNIYGLDIDDRAGQMAYFAVMMKARQYNRRILDKDCKYNVYAIQDSNGITSAPMHDMGIDLSSDEYSKAVKEAMKLVEEFHDAKEYGSIIDVEEHDWELLKRFAVPRASVDGQMSLDIHGEQAASARLQQLIKIGKNLAQKYEVVITNPPYMAAGGMGAKLSKYVKKYYENGKNDMFSVFIEKCLKMARTKAYVAMITQHSWMFLSRYAGLREEISYSSIVNMAHLGARAFEEIAGEVVQTTAFIIEKQYIKGYLGKYKRLVDGTSQKEKEHMFLASGNEFVANQDNFKIIPDSPIGYHLSEKIFEVFKNQYYLSDVGNARQGLGTSDNIKFLRLWSEVVWNRIGFGLSSCEETLSRSEKWFPYIKGGTYRRWYPNKEYVVNYANDGADIKKAVMSKYTYLNSPDFVVKNTSTYFKAGITWSDVATGLFGGRWVDSGYIYADAGPMFFPDEEPFIKLGYMNTPVFQLFGDLICQGIHYSTGQIPTIPYINIGDTTIKEIIEECVKANIELSRQDWNSFESSWEMKKHPLMKGTVMGRLISDKYKEWEEECNSRFNQLKANEEELNRIFIEIYGLQDELTPEVDEKDVTVRKAELQRDIKSLLSYAVGCMFGRYSLDVEGLVYAGGEWDSSKYSSFIPDEDNVIPITDEEYLEDDIVTRLCEFFKVVYGEDTLEDNLDFIAKALGNKGDTSRDIIRNYFLNDFYKDHCQTYSVTGSGKRPIYWLFDSGKQNGFKALIYLHRYNADTVGNLRIDYLHRMQKVYESEIGRMQDMMDHSTNNREVALATKRKEKLTKQLKECRDYDEKIGHLALERTELDLDDGVKYNYRRLQTGSDGKFYEVLADSKSIMMDDKKYKDFKKN